MRHPLCAAFSCGFFFCCVVSCGDEADVVNAVVVAEDVVVVDVNGASAEDGRVVDAAAIDHGRDLFLHEWVKGDEIARGGDGLGPLWNASSCVACHNQGGAGGGGGNHVNVVVADGKVWPHHGKTRLKDLGLGGLGTGTGSASGSLNVLFEVATRANILGASSVPAPTTASLTTVAMPTATGPLDPTVLRRQLVRTRPALDLCTQENASFSVSFIVDVKGRVQGPRVAGGAAQPEAQRCIAAALTRTSFPTADAPTKVTAQLIWKGAFTPPPEPEPPPSVVVERNASALFGAGAIDRIDDEVIADGAAVSIVGHAEITGKVGRSPEGRVTRFGWKGDVADLATFVSRACAVEVGLEVPGAPQPGRRDRSNPPGLDLNTEDLLDLIAYVRELPRPAQTTSTAASNGAEVFDSIGCSACHRAALGDVDGLYSDLLLHDLGEELDDAADVGYYGGPPVGNSREWRTPPLWGVRDSGPWLHDGRADRLDDAIDLHGGEAWKVRAAWWKLGAKDRADLLAFLGSLHAPR